VIYVVGVVSNDNFLYNKKECNKKKLNISFNELENAHSVPTTSSSSSCQDELILTLL